MPAMHAADGIGMNWEGDVLMHPGIAPPDSLRLGVGAIVWRNAFQLAHLPLAFCDFFQINPRTRHSLNLILFINPPPAKMMRAGNYAWRQAFRDPRVQHEVSDLGVNFHQIAGAHATELFRIDRV